MISYKDLPARVIIEFYVTKYLPLWDIARKFNTTAGVIARVLEKNNVPRRKGGKENYTQKLIVNDSYHGLSESSIRKHVKRHLIKKNGNICSICLTKKWLKKPVPLVCDHIDGDTSNTNFSNFRLVCCNCDAQLSTYKSKNRGKGRAYHREYYHKRKSNFTSCEARS